MPLLGKKRVILPPFPPPPKCSVKVGKVISVSQRFNAKKGAIRGGEKQSKANISRADPERVQGSCAMRGIRDVGKVARRKSKYAESKPEHIESKIW